MSVISKIGSHLKRQKGFYLLIVFILSFKSSIYDWSFVPSGSMQPTIADGEQVSVNKMAYDLFIPFSHYSLYQLSEPKFGDIVIFDSEKKNIRMIKRVIGLPGDNIIYKSNKLTINDQVADYEQIQTYYLQDTIKNLDKSKFENGDYDYIGNNIYAKYLKESIMGVEHLIRLEEGYQLPKEMDAVYTIPAGYYFVMGDNRNNSNDSRFWGLVKRSEIIGQAGFVAFSLDLDNYFMPRFERFFNDVK